MTSAVDPMLPHLLGLLPGSARDEGATDAELLRRFAGGRDEPAFAELVRRHGRLVLGVCRRVLGDAHAAEDAFQATFLLLARRAGKLARPGSVAGWLHAVALRVSRQSRRADERRRRREQGSARPAAAAAPDPTWAEVRQLLDAELARLPEQYRTPLVLCYLEGLTQAEAARRLGWGGAVLRGRLERGRQALRRRLARLGLPLAAPLLLLTVPPAVPAALRAATLATARTALAGGPVAPAVAGLAAGAASFFVSPWKVVVGLLLIALTGVGLAGARHFAAAPPPPPEPPPANTPAAPKPRVDRLGDPLPPDALLRLGTLRHRHLNRWGSCYQLLTNGKTALTGDRSEVRWVDMATGRVIDTWRLPKGFTAAGFSPDGRLAVLHDKETIRLWDLAARKEVRTFRGKGPVGHQVYALFAPDGKVVVTDSGVNYNTGLVRVWEIATGREMWQEGVMGDAYGGLSPVGFLPDGETLVVQDKADNRISLRDRATGKERRSFATMPLNESRSRVLSADGKAVLMGTAGTAVRVWDVTTGKERAPLGGHKDQARSVAISRDGKTVLTGGGDPFVLVWEWPAGKLRRMLDLGAGRGIDAMAVSADGKRAELTCWGENALRFFDLGTGKELPPPVEGHRGPVHGVAVTPDGRVVSAGTDNTFRVWDLRTGRHLSLHRTEHPVGTMSFSLSADGRLVATAEINRGTVALHERDTGRPVRTINTGGQSVLAVAFVPAGRLLAAYGIVEKAGAGGSKSFLAFWDADTGREVRRLEMVRTTKLAFSPDGRLLAMVSDEQVRLSEVETGQVRQALSQQGVFAVAFSPDGRTLACGDKQGITLWELAAGKERCRITAPGERPSRALRFSPDGRWLALAGGSVVQLCDVSRGRKVHSFAGHDGDVTGLAFTPDGRTLASSSFDSSVLVWDVAGVAARQPGPKARPDAAAVASAWNDLAGADAVAAYRAVWRLAEAPAQSLPLLRERLRPATPLDVKRVEKLLADLDSDRFAERDRATKELERLGDQAEPTLRRFLAGSPSLEGRRRAEGLLARVEGPVTDPERLRQLRALEVLERIGGEARPVLKALAGGATDARLTREAKASLERVARSPGR
jgi:RNA polymerase sigma factor (sigma-70 family)